MVQPEGGWVVRFNYQNVESVVEKLQEHDGLGLILLSTQSILILIKITKIIF